MELGYQRREMIKVVILQKKRTNCQLTKNQIMKNFD
jgi:hypothetical protein